MDFECIETWLELPEFRVTGQIIWPHGLEWHLERREMYLICPRCQTSCSRVQARRSRCMRDVPIFERPVLLRLHVRRFECDECEHRPWEKSDTFGVRVKWTERLDDQGRQEFLHGCPCKELAQRYGLSARTVCRWTCEKSRGGRPRQLGRALGRDAYSRRKGHRYNTIIVDWDTGRPITTLKGRRFEDVVAWFKSRPQAELEGVEVVVLARSKSFYAAIKEVFGDHVHVIDRFHVVKQAVDGRDKVLRSVPNQLEPPEAKELKKLRKRWLKSAHQLDVDELIARADWRRRFPELREVIDWVQDVRKWFERKDDKPARAALLTLLARASESAGEPLQSMAGT